jgi:transposase InsO family protein
MSFKENLKKKMLIDTLSRTVSESIGSPERPWKVDKETMRRLLSLSPFVVEKRRDLELYFRQLEPGIGEILVLDNDLPLYGKTTLDDVTLRKSPELKEMISIRNVIKILHQKELFEYIEVFYNRKRKHSTLGYQTPVRYEQAMKSAVCF